MKSFVFLFGCFMGLGLWSTLSAQTRLSDLSLPTMHGQAYPLNAVKQSPLSVFFFLAPECPLCENYAVSIKALRQRYPRTQVSFYGIFAGNTYTAEEITHFMARFHLPVKALRDGDYLLTHYFHASVTPEVFVVNAQSELLYQGKIDNWIASLGSKRQQPSRFYLRDALDAALAGERIVVSSTVAVGCLIE